MGGAAAALVAFATTFLLIRLIAPVAQRIGLVDEPGGRKTHDLAIPLVGGIAIMAGWVLGYIVSGGPVGAWLSLFAGAMVALITGLLDDLHELSARARFAAQVGASLIMIFSGGVLLQDFGWLVGPFVLDLSWLAIPVTVFCAVGVMNAVNMSDGMDGLAASSVLICLGGILLMATLAGAASVGMLTGLLAAAVLAFWLHNHRFHGQRPARVFLGDAGSLTLGFVLAWLLISGSQGAERLFSPVTALWLLAGPLCDAVFVMFRRLVNGQSPFHAGRDHLHHLFLRAGFSVRQTWAFHVLLLGAAAGFGIGTELAGIPEYLRFYAFVLVSILYYFAVSRAWSRARWLGRPVAG